MNWLDQPQPAHRSCLKRDSVAVREWMLVSHCLIENLIPKLSCDWTACGLLLVWPGGELWAIEVKRSLSPKVERGFHSACEDLGPARKLVVYPGSESFALGNDVHAVPLHALCRELAAKAL